jgi:hypothetical protein
MVNMPRSFGKDICFYTSACEWVTEISSNPRVNREDMPIAPAPDPRRSELIDASAEE